LGCGAFVFYYAYKIVNSRCKNIALEITIFNSHIRKDLEAFQSPRSSKKAGERAKSDVIEQTVCSVYPMM